jgi:GNAT superfamily N-acetyltransferase
MQDPENAKPDHEAVPSAAEDRPGTAGTAIRPEIVIRQATIEDREAIWAFMKAAYDEEAPGTARYKFPQRWIWQFADNPFVRERGKGLPIWLALVGGEIAGQMCAMPMRLKAGDRVLDGGWGCDFIVLKKYRGLGIGWRLNKAYCEHFQIVVHVTQALATEKMWERCGSLSASPVRVMWRIFRLSPDFVFRYVAGKARSRPRLDSWFRRSCRVFYLHGLIAAVVNVGAFFRTCRLRPRAAGGESFEEVTSFDQDFADFIETASAGYDVLVKRDPKFLGWRYLSNPTLPYHVFVLRTGGAVKGYIVVRDPHPAELNMGVIADVFTARDDGVSMEALLARALAFFGRRVGVIQVLASSPCLAEVLRKNGFLTRKSYDPHFVCSDPVLRAWAEGHRGDWYITFADHDQDQIRPAE